MKPFDAELRKLSLMIGHPMMMERFATEYKRLLEETYLQMSIVRNADKLLEGEYTARGLMLQSLLHRQIESLGGKVPAPRNREKAVETDA